MDLAAPLTEYHKSEIVEVLQFMMDRPADELMGPVYGMCLAAEGHIGRTYGSEFVRFDWAEIHGFVRNWCRENGVTDQFSDPCR